MSSRRRVAAFLRLLGLTSASALDDCRQTLEVVKEKLRRRVARQRAEDAARVEYVAAMLTMNARDLARRRGEGAMTREQWWIGASPDYAEARAQWLGGVEAAGTERRELAGLIWSVPQGRDEEGTLSHRLLHRGWLPVGAVAEVQPFARGGVMLDIGANIGTRAVLRMTLGDFDCVYAAEPNGANYRCLVQNVLANHLGGLVIPDRVALSHAPGSAHLRMTTAIGGHHLVDDPRAHATEIVRVVTMDQWLAQLEVDPGEVRFVKVDTQGWDVRVLEGAQDLLSRRRAVWQIEVSPSMLKRAGSSVGDLVTLVRANFTHVRELGKKRTAPWVPSSSVEDVLARMSEHRQFCDLLLFNLPS